MGAQWRRQGTRVAAHADGRRDDPDAQSPEFRDVDRGIAAGLGAAHTPDPVLHGRGQELRLQQARKLVERGVECLVLVGEAQPAALFDLLRSQHVPYVDHLHQPVATRTHTCIGFDNYAAAARMTEHLLELGHRNFGMVAHERGQRSDPAAHRRDPRHAGPRSGIAIRPQHLVQVDSRHIASGREGCDRFWRMGHSARRR